MARPNILFIMADQFRFDALGCVKGWTLTPNLDRLAAAGTLFTNTISNSLKSFRHGSAWQSDSTRINPVFGKTGR